LVYVARELGIGCSPCKSSAFNFVLRPLGAFWMLHDPALMPQSLCMCTDISLLDSTLDFIGSFASFPRLVGMVFPSLLQNTSTSSVSLSPLWWTAQVGVPHTLLYLAACNKLLHLLYSVIVFKFCLYHRKDV